MVARRCSAGACGRVLIVVRDTSATKTQTRVRVFSIMRLNHELFRRDVPVELSRKLSGTCVIMSPLRASARDANGSCTYRFRIQFESFPHPFKMHMLCVRWMPRQIDCLDLLQTKIKA